MTPRFELTTLGSLALRRDGELVVTLGARRLTFLAILAAAGPRGMAREKLAALFWPDSSEERSRAALKQLTYVFRKALGADAVVVGPTELRIDQQMLIVDVLRFEALMIDGNPEEAVQQYLGPFLDGVHVDRAVDLERWIDERRDALAARYAGALAEACRRSLASGQPDRAADWAERAVAIDRSDSGATIRLMECLRAAGRLNAAVQVAAQYENWMRLELELPPDPSVGLCAERLRSEAALASSRAASMAKGRASNSGDGIAQTSGVTSPGAQIIPVESAHGPRRIRAWSSIAIGVSVFALAAMVGWARYRHSVAERRPPLVALVPFHVSAADSSLKYLGEGMVDLLSPKLTVDGLPRAIAPAKVISAWTTLRARLGRDPDDDDAARLAGESGASRVVTGSVVGSRDAISLSASLIDVHRMRTVASAQGGRPESAIPRLIDQLAAELLSIELGGDPDAQPRFGDSPITAVRAYAEGRSSFRRGDYRAAFDRFQLAVAEDSTFALAALDLSRTAGWLSESGTRVRARELAWRYRDRLSRGDRVLLDAIVGVHYPGPTDINDRIAMWERATQAVPDEPDTWFELGDQLFHAAELVGDRDGVDRVIPSLERAIERDSSYGPAYEHLVQFASREGDTLLVRHIEGQAIVAQNGTGEGAFVEWRTAVLLGGRESKLRQLRARFDSLDHRSLVDIALASLFDAVSIEDGERALRAVVATSADENTRVDALAGLHAVQLSRGHRADALATLARLASSRTGRAAAAYLTVLDAVFAGTDTTAAARSLAFLDSIRRRPLDWRPDTNARGSRATVRQRELATCVEGQWFASRGRTSGAGAAVADLGDVLRFAAARSKDNEQFESEARLCSAAIVAWSNVLDRSPSALASVEALDSLLRGGPSKGTMLESELPLLTARLFVSLGDPGRALVAIRRQGYFYKWPHYRRETLQLEARLAEAAGDRSGAVRAQRAYRRLTDSALTVAPISAAGVSR